MSMRSLIPFLLIAFLTGCVTPEEPTESLVDTDESMEFLEPGLKPEVILFPDYLLMEDFELNQHGGIRESSLVGGGLKTALGLKAVRRRFNDALVSHGWTIDTIEIGKSSFRLKASLKGEFLEIRAVQGSGPTQVFLLYQPLPEPESLMKY